MDEGWINGGFFVLNSEITGFINGYTEMFEQGVSKHTLTPIVLIQQHRFEQRGQANNQLDIPIRSYLQILNKWV